MYKFVITLTLIFTISCGTETGNPNLGVGDQSSSLSARTLLILSTACSKLSECYSATLTKEQCETALILQDGFDSELGLSAFDYSSFQEIVDAESASTITPNETEATQCQTDLEDLSCSDGELTSAYSSSSPNDFSNSHKIIPAGAGSCNDVF